jgi:hypothetical protein
MFYGQYTGFGGGGDDDLSFIGILTSLGLTTDLELCLDAGDSVSYTSGQTWTDRSGSSHHFYRGDSASSAADDPTFNGTAGNLSSNEYFSFDGGDWFGLTQSNPAWVNNLHKDNAKWTAFVAAYPTNGGLDSDDQVVGTHGGEAAGIGIGWVFRKNELTMRVSTRDGGGNPAEMEDESALTWNADAWNIAGVAVDEGGGASASAHLVNGSTETFNGAATAPTASNATYTIEIGRAGGPSGFIMDNGSRMACFAMWSDALSTTNMLAIRNKLKGRFGI